MSVAEVSMLSSNHKLEPSTERYFIRPQRPPPPPPTQVQPPSPRVEQPAITREPEISSPPAETSTEPVENLEKNHPTLLSKFQQLFHNFDFESVREDILNRNLIECDFTTVLWRIFLHCLPRDSNQWEEMLETSRRSYEKLLEKYTIDPYKMNGEENEIKSLNHPLSLDENSLWAQYFAGERLKETITIDVRRTCPDILFFRNPRMVDLQLRILFTHSRHYHKTVPYRQGMHEIAGIVVYTIYSESLKINQYEKSNELMKKLYDPQYLEHDSYALFEKIIEHLRQFYALTKNNSIAHKPANVHDLKQIPFQELNDVHIQLNDSALRMNLIFERLKHYDPMLYCKLEELKIEPTVYGIRWLRILFGREVPFESIPNLWTVVFCFDEHFGFADYFFIALLMEVGRIISKQGHLTPSHFLQSLMKQNIITSVEPVIRKALNLTGKQLEPVPEETSIPSTPNSDGARRNSLDDERVEDKTQAKVQRVPLVRASEPRLMPPFIKEFRKPTSPPQTNHPNNQMHSKKSNSSNTTPLTSPPSNLKPSSSTASIDSELDFLNGKTTRQQYEDNVRLQKNCAHYMNKFVERLQTQVCDLGSANEEELYFQLAGLKQIANVLDGQLTFDSSILQTLLDFKPKEKVNEANKSDINEQS